MGPELRGKARYSLRVTSPLTPVIQRQISSDGPFLPGTWKTHSQSPWPALLRGSDPPHISIEDMAPRALGGGPDGPLGAVLIN